MNKFLLLISAVLTFGLFSCSDAPTEIGADLMPPGDNLTLQTWNSLEHPIPQTSSYEVDTISMNYSRAVLLGEVANDVKSHMLLKFFFYQSIPDSVLNALKADSLTIISASISAPIIYRYGDGSEVNFSVHKITDNWSALDFTIDSLNSLVYDTQNDFISEEVTDSTFEFSFQPNMIYDWFWSEVVDSVKNYGIYLKPEGGNLVLGFPALTSSMTNSRMKLTCVVQKTNGFIDTLDFYSSADVHVAERNIPLNETGKIILSGSAIARGKVKMDLTSLSQRIIVNKAVLKLFINEDETLQGSNPSDTLYFTMIKDSTGNVGDNPTEVIGSGDSTHISANITKMVQKWLNHPETNFGIRLRLSDEKTSVNKLVFYGSDYSDSTKRPYLELVYTKMN